MITVLSRAPNDDFTFSLFASLVNSLTCEHEAYYIWSDPPAKLVPFLETTEFTKPNIIIGIKDLLDLWTEYNFWHDTTQPGIKLLDNLANRYPDKNFIIFTSLENVNLEFIKSTNLQFIQWGGDIVNQSIQYQTVTPVLDKNFDSTKTFISLNRNIRHHRLVLLSYLFGNNYNQAGNITYIGQNSVGDKNYSDFLDWVDWEFNPEQDSIRKIILEGYPKFYNNDKLAIDHYKIYDKVNDNVTNFNRSLRSKYQDSFVEIISESSFAAPSFMITEKFLNSVYGFNFPILLSGVGAVDHLRLVGFDMFDDVVKHNYDRIANPFDRIVTAIEDNKQLLLDSNYAKHVWQQNTQRFNNNVIIASTKMYNWYQDRAITQFKALTFNNN